MHLAAITSTSTITDFSQLTARWWLNFLRQPDVTDDVYFVDGKMLQLNDKRIHETNNIVTREKMIVIPVDNWISLDRKYFFGNKQKIETRMKKTAKERMDRVTKLSLKIDDHEMPVTSERIVSPMFTLNINKDNIHFLQNLEIGSVQKGNYYALSDGYWLFVQPNSFSHGPHTVETFGSCATGLLELEIHHHFSII